MSERSRQGKAKIVQALSQQRSSSARKHPAREGARPQVSTLVLFGELRERELSKLGETLLHLARSGQLNVVLDVRHVSHLHFRGVKALGLLARTFRLGGGDLKLAGPSRYLHEVLKAGGVTGLFDVHATPEDAALAFQPEARALTAASEPHKEQVPATIIVIGK